MFVVLLAATTTFLYFDQGRLVEAAFPVREDQTWVFGIIDTIGAFRCRAPVEPKKRASPNVKIPPSAATSQYPCPEGVAVMPTTGADKRRPPTEPWKRAVPPLNTPPSDATAQNPLPSGVDATPTSGALMFGSRSDARPRAAPNPVTNPVYDVPVGVVDAPDARGQVRRASNAIVVAARSNFVRTDGHANRTRWT